MRKTCEDLARAADAGALLLADPKVEIVRRDGRVIRFNPGAPADVRASAIDHELAAMLSEVETGAAPPLARLG